MSVAAVLRSFGWVLARISGPRNAFVDQPELIKRVGHDGMCRFRALPPVVCQAGMVLGMVPGTLGGVRDNDDTFGSQKMFVNARKRLVNT